MQDLILLFRILLPHQPERKADRQCVVSIYSTFPFFMQMEYRSKLLWAENILVFMQLHGTQL